MNMRSIIFSVKTVAFRKVRKARKYEIRITYVVIF